MDEDLHLAWDRASLEALLRKVIPNGESAKVDFKSIFDLSDDQQKGEFLKDVSAMANTYTHNYKNYGFIVFGISDSKISFTSFPNNEDHIQASIDDLVKKYLRPFISTHFFIFEEVGKNWGVIVIPPTRNAPHIFCNDIHKRHRGDVYVRNGTITEKAQPEDYVRFFRQHIEEHTYEFRQNISDLQREVSKISSQIKKVKTSPHSSGNTKKVNIISPSPTLPEKENRSVTEKINVLLKKEEDEISVGLFEEVKKITKFIDSHDIPWDIQSADKKTSEEILSKIETTSREFWLAIIELMIKDEKGVYDDALIKALGYLAHVIEAPSGVRYTNWGVNIRYYPLFVALYLICIIGVEKKKDKIIKRTFKINLRNKSRYDQSLPISYILFKIRSASEVFQHLHPSFPQRWCDSVASYSKTLIDRILVPDDPLWDKEASFFRGEFVLCIMPMDIIEENTKSPMIGHPSSGLFLFIYSAVPILAAFLKHEREWIRKLFDRSLEEILTEFDKTAQRLANSSNCFGGGFEGGAFEITFPEKIPKKEESK